MFTLGSNKFLESLCVYKISYSQDLTVNSAILNRIFSIHFILPYTIAGLTIVHLALFHRDGSNNLLGTGGCVDKISFYSYFFVKDLRVFFLFLFVFAGLVYFYQNAWGILTIIHQQTLTISLRDTFYRPTLF